MYSKHYIILQIHKKMIYTEDARTKLKRLISCTMGWSVDYQGYNSKARICEDLLPCQGEFLLCRGTL